MITENDLQRLEAIAYQWQYDDLIVVDLTDDHVVGNYTDATQHYRDAIFDLLAEIRRLRALYETPQLDSIVTAVNDPANYEKMLL